MDDACRQHPVVDRDLHHLAEHVVNAQTRRRVLRQCELDRGRWVGWILLILSEGKALRSGSAPGTLFLVILRRSIVIGLLQPVQYVPGRDVDVGILIIPRYERG